MGMLRGLEKPVETFLLDARPPQLQPQMAGVHHASGNVVAAAGDVDKDSKDREVVETQMKRVP